MTTETVELPDELAAYYRQVLLVHARQTGSGRCAVCGTARCVDWIGAYDRLAAAGQLMTEFPLWEAFVPGERA